VPRMALRASSRGKKATEMVEDWENIAIFVGGLQQMSMRGIGSYPVLGGKRQGIKNRGVKRGRATAARLFFKKTG